MATSFQAPAQGWRRELHEYTRGLAGAYLLGIPLLYTMEMWWIGEYLSTTHMLSLLGFALLLNYALASVGGFRRDRPILGALEEALDAVAIGAFGSIIVLAVLNRITWADPFGSNLGVIILQTVPLSIGASVSNIIFAQPQGEENGIKPHQQQRAQNSSLTQRTLTDIGATVAGAIVIGFSIAPTEEIPMLSSQLGWINEIALIAVSILITYIMVFASGFDPEEVTQDHGVFQHPWTETSISYVISLILSFVMLLLFQQISFDDPWHNTMSQVLVLGLPAAVGGAAGRVAI